MNKNDKVLIVDDDIDFLEAHRMLLESKGFETLTAESRKEAEELLKENKPAFAIIDLMMEEADGGFVLANAIKRKYPDCPVVIATSVTSETGMEFDDGTGEGNDWVKADAVLAKPIRPEELQSVIQKISSRTAH
jgi:CheY-like chemotaxis protein